MPKDVNRKFNADGSVRSFAGNTFVGHIEQQGAGFQGFDTLLNVYREVPKYSFKEKIALLPPSSYHITVFVGVNDEDRNTPRWRDGLDRATPINKITSETTKLLKSRKKTHYAPFEFILDDIPL
ncbi:hypothetical protein UNDKW_0154 [Undibacterium sp. KW1]|nr:hypothetical protein UNDKW_0154 [Undibacterium sp. KW1]